MAGRDQYMNFFTMEVTSNADASTIASEDYNTGAGVSTLLAWRIHSVEYLTLGTPSGAVDTYNWQVVVSTRKGLTTIPDLTDKGTIAKFVKTITLYGAGTGFGVGQYPNQTTYLPPMIVASPNFTIYYKGSHNFNGMQSKLHQVRIGFTTERLDDSAYREVFETWNYAN
jgi:hypothetical protein